MGERWREVMRELGRIFLQRERVSGILSLSTRASGEMRQTELEGAGTRGAEMEDERLRLCHYDKQREHLKRMRGVKKEGKNVMRERTDRKGQRQRQKEKIIII